MLALVSKSPGIELADVPVPDPSAEVLVRVLLSGVCATDIQITKGYAGFSGTLGHEFVGIAEANCPAELRGKRIVGEINVGCGTCELCAGGDERHCPARTVLGIKGRDGSHAEFLTLPERNLHILPDSISDEAAVFIEPLAAALGILERVPLERFRSAAVIGDGKLGLLTAFALASAMQRVTLIGKHASKLNIARKRGIDTVDALVAGSLLSSFDLVVEASGSESGFAAALDIVEPRGTIVLKSTFHGMAKWEAWRVVVDEISVVGSRCGRFGPAIEKLASGEIEVEDLISDSFPLSRGVEAFEAAAKTGVLKVILEPGR